MHSAGNLTAWLSPRRAGVGRSGDLADESRSHRASGHGKRVSLPYELTLLAEVYGNAGQTLEVLRLLAEVRATIHRSEERWWEPELCRLEGEPLLRQAGETDLKSAPTPTSLATAGD